MPGHGPDRLEIGDEVRLGVSKVTGGVLSLPTTAPGLAAWTARADG
ncbi:MAG: hypothetical protein M3301_04475 [Chloroflexota bacterium]|nr:hypothetical protein [Chloroflexota bacterium]